MNELKSAVWHDPFESETYHLWQETAGMWAVAPCGLIHVDETFGKLEVFQKASDVFEISYEGWVIRIMADSGKMEIVKRSVDGLSAFYIFERIALPILRLLRGCLLLHASCVDMSGRCVAFLAQTGTGKTTVSGALLNLPDCRLVAEDTLSIVDGDGVKALPSADYLAVRHYLLDGMDGIEFVEDMGIKRILHLNPKKCRKEPLTLDGLMVLSGEGNGAPGPVENKQEILPLLLRQQMSFSNAPSEFKRRQFQAMMSLVRNMPVYRMGIDLSCDDRMRECVGNLADWRMRL